MGVFQERKIMVTVSMFVAASHCSYFNRFASNADLDKKTCKASAILFEHENFSILRCSYKCHVTSRCAGFSYNAERMVCTGCSNQYVHDQLYYAEFLNDTDRTYFKGDWTNYGGILYSFYPYRTDFPTAFNYCLDRNGYLARIDSDKKQAFLNESCSGHGTWISLTDEGHNTVWKWLNDNTTTNYTNWCLPDHPFEDEKHNCGIVSSFCYFQWASHMCDFAIGEALCERELN